MAKSQERSYEASASRVYQAALQATSKLGYRILSSDSEARSVSFNTGMSMRSWAGQDVTAMSVTDGADSARLVVGGGVAKGGVPTSGGSQIGSWGELGKVTKRFYEAVERVLPDVEDLEPTAPTSSVAEEIERLTELHRQGALTEEEFTAAKTRLLGTS